MARGRKVKPFEIIVASKPSCAPKYPSVEVALEDNTALLARLIKAGQAAQAAAREPLDINPPQIVQSA